MERYLWVLRMALWGEPPERRVELLDLWVDYLEEFRRDHSSLRFCCELVLGGGSHVWSRLCGPGSTSTVLPVLGMVIGAVATAGTNFADLPTITYSLLSDIHFIFSILMLAFAYGRGSRLMASDRVRLFALVLMSSGFLHTLFGATFSHSEPLLVVYLGAAALGLFMMAVSAWRTGYAFGQSYAALAVLNVGLLFGAAWTFSQAAFFGWSLLALSFVVGAASLVIVVWGFHRVVTHCVRYRPELNFSEM